MKIKRLKEYAYLIAHKGINVQKGRKYILDCPVEQHKFALLLIEELYKSGASHVQVNYQDSSSKYAYTYCDIKDLSYFPRYKTSMYKTFLKEKRGRIVLTSPRPSIMDGLDINKITKVSQKSSRKYDFFSSVYGENKLEWCIAAVPNIDWAKKVFPNETPSKALEMLWDAILNTLCVKGDNTSIDRWIKHNHDNKVRAEKLNNLNLKSLHFTSDNGTDLEIGLVKDYIFEGGTSFTPDNVEFDANMPTEEIFTMPHNKKINGIVYSTKPLFIMGKIIENFGFKFKDGKIYEVLCENKEHKDILEFVIKSDEGASSLGEVALVANSSPINQTGILFFNTLFDENASCHIALGDSYITNLKNNEKYTKEELKELGSNNSIIHIDFMIGCSTTKVVGTTYDDNKITILENGEFVI